MSYYSSFDSRPSYRPSFKMSSAIKQLIIINFVVYFISVVLFIVGPQGVHFKFYNYFIGIFGVVPATISHKFFLWQFVTYMFIHSLSPWHIIFNMLMLFFLGRLVENRIGKKAFLKLYFTAGIGAGLIHLILNINSSLPMIGASGAVYGVIMALAMIAPEQPITLLLFFVLPITLKVKHLVLGIIFIVVMGVLLMGVSDTGVAHWAHLGGLFFGYLFMRVKYRLPLPFRIRPRIKLYSRPRIRRPKAQKYHPIDADTFISEEIDPILEKISRSGINSLTRKERRILKRAHGHMRDTRPRH